MRSPRKVDDTRVQSFERPRGLHFFQRDPRKLLRRRQIRWRSLHQGNHLVRSISRSLQMGYQKRFFFLFPLFPELIPFLNVAYYFFRLSEFNVEDVDPDTVVDSSSGEILYAAIALIILLGIVSTICIVRKRNLLRRRSPNNGARKSKRCRRNE